MRPAILLPLIVACALFMENMDSSVIATSLPAIAIDLHENPIALKLALTSYLVSLAVFIPISGWCADRFGARTIFAGAIVVFVSGSIACAASSTLEGFVAARFFQGMGGAMMVPVGRLVLLRAVPKSDMLRALTWVTIPALTGPVFGPPLGGFITTYFHWRWIFLINVPIGILGLFMVLRHVPNLREDDRAEFDLAGFVLTGVGLATVMLGLATLGGHMLPTSVSFACLAAGAAVLGVYWLYARHRANPVLDFELYKVNTFRAGVLGGAFLRISSGTIPFLLPLMLQLGFHLNPLESGLLTCATAVGALFMKTLTQRILRAWNFRRALLRAAALSAVLMMLIGLLTPATPHLVILLLLTVGGCFRSLQYTAVNGISYADIENPRMSRATSMVAMIQQLSQGLGVTFGAAALEIASAWSGVERPGVPEFHVAFIAAGAAGLASMLFFATLKNHDGSEVSGYRPRVAATG